MTQTYTLSHDGDDISAVIPLEQVKAWLKVEHDGDDAQITDLIKSSADEIEAYTGKVIMEQTALLNASLPRRDTIYFHKGPVTSVSSVQVANRTGDPTDLIQGEDYEFNEAVQQLYIISWDKLANARYVAPLQINLLIGYADSSDKKPPQPFITAIQHRVAECYENREAPVELSAAVKRMVAPYKRVAV